MNKLIGVKGSPLTEEQLTERILARVEVRSVDVCWPWLGPISKDGYGKQGVTYAHRVVYKWHYGKAPDVVDHICRNRSCQNPHHMKSVTKGENTRRGAERTKPLGDSCANGHPWGEKNLYLSPKGHRVCRECRRIGMRKK